MQRRLGGPRPEAGRTWKVAVVVGCALAGAVGCGGEARAPAAAPAPASVAAPAKEPMTLEEAQAQLERARAELGVPVATASGPEGKRGETTPATAGGAAPESAGPSGAASAPHADSARPADAPGPGDARCAGACRAVISMERAVEAICRIVGEPDPRCVDARSTLRDSEGRVFACACP